MSGTNKTMDFPLTIWTKKWNNKNQSISVQCITWDDYAQFVSCLSQCHHYFFQIEENEGQPKAEGRAFNGRGKKNIKISFSLSWMSTNYVMGRFQSSRVFKRFPQYVNFSFKYTKHGRRWEFRVNVTSTDGARYPVHLTLCSFTHCMYRFVCYL